MRKLIAPILIVALVFGMFFLYPNTTFAAVSLVQSKIDNTNASISFATTPAQGDLIVVAISLFQAIGANSVSDNQTGNTYTLIQAQQGGPETDNVAIFYAKNVNSTGTFTITYGGSGTISIYDYSGADKTSPLDQKNSATGTGTQLNSGNVTVAPSGELYFGAAWSLIDGDTWTAGTGWGSLLQQETDNNTFERQATENLLTSSSTASATFTTSSSAAWISVIATFKSAAAVATIGTPTVTVLGGSTIIRGGSTIIR